MSSERERRLSLHQIAGVGVRYIVYWHLLSAEPGSQALKVNLIVYDNDMMQVTGTSFFLWVLECYQTMARQVETLMSEKFTDEGIGPDVCCKREHTVCSKETETEKAQASFARIVTKLQNLNSEVKTLSKSLGDLTEGHQRHTENTKKNNEDTQERINFMNYRILEIRQLTGPKGLSAAHLSRIKKIKRGSIFEDKTLDDPGLDENELNESEQIVTEAIVSMFKNKKKKVDSRSPSKIPAENTNLLRKPKNDDSSETSSIKDSGYEEPDNDRQKRREKSKEKAKKSDAKYSPVKVSAEDGRSRKISQRKNVKEETKFRSKDFPEETTISPVFSLQEINSIWATNEEDDEDKGKSSVESIKNESDDNDLLSPISSRTTILD